MMTTTCKHEELVLGGPRQIDGATFPVFLYTCKACDTTLAVSELAYVQKRVDQVENRIGALDRRVTALDARTSLERAPWGSPNRYTKT